MTEQEINIAVAEVLGVPVDVCMCGEEIGSHHIGGTEHSFVPMADAPDYCHDLNAMHEAEKVLTPDQEETYVSGLGAAVMCGAYEDDPRWVKSHLSSDDSTYRATARQRAEAFLRTLGKWKG